MHETPKVGELLLHAGIIDELQLKAALAEQNRWGRRLGVTLIKMGMVEENHLIQALAQQLGLPATSLVGRRIAPEVISLVPARIARDHHVMPLFVKRNGSAGKLFLGMEDPSKLEVLDDLCFRTGLEIQPVMMGPTELGNAIGRYYDRVVATDRDRRPDSSAETTIGERSMGLSEQETASAAKAANQANKIQGGGVRDTIQSEPAQHSSRDNAITLLDVAPEPSAELAQGVDTAIRESEKTRLVVKALTQLLVEKQLLSLDEIQDRIAKLKGGGVTT